MKNYNWFPALIRIKIKIWAGIYFYWKVIMTENEPRNKKFLMMNIGWIIEIFSWQKNMMNNLTQIWRQTNTDISIFYFSKKKIIRIDNNVLFVK